MAILLELANRMQKEVNMNRGCWYEAKAFIRHGGAQQLFLCIRDCVIPNSMPQTYYSGFERQIWVQKESSLYIRYRDRQELVPPFLPVLTVVNKPFDIRPQNT